MFVGNLLHIKNDDENFFVFFKKSIYQYKEEYNFIVELISTS